MYRRPPLRGAQEVLGDLGGPAMRAANYNCCMLHTYIHVYIYIYTYVERE